MTAVGRRFVLGATLALSLHAGSAHAQAADGTTRILMLYSHDPKAAGVVAFAHGLEDVVRRELPGHLQVYEETLDFDRVENRDGWPQLAAYIAAKYSGIRLDAVVAEGSIALQFGVEKLATVLPRVPLVYGSAFEPVVDFGALPPNVTGRQVPLPFAETFAFARRLQPDARRVVLVAGAGALDTLLSARAVHDITPLLHGMQLDVLQHWSYPSLLQRLRELPKGTFVILSSLRKDSGGESFNTGEIIPSLTRASSAPVYGVVRNWLGQGIVGGTTMQFADEGERTGRLLLRVLRQPRGSRLPAAEVATNSDVADWRELQRWGLSESLLPKGTEVVFRTPSPWERYGAAIFAILGVVIAQAVLIGLLLLERRRRIRAQRLVEGQAGYDRMLAVLRAEAVQHFPEETPRALENAIAHIGRYAGATSAELVIHVEYADQPSPAVRWKEKPSVAEAVVAKPVTPLLELPLVCASNRVGTLVLRDVSMDCEMGTTTWERLRVATTLIAVALSRAQASRALAESRGHVAHLGRIAAMGQLGAMVSHELRQPLTAIRYNAEAGAPVGK